MYYVFEQNYFLLTQIQTTHTVQKHNAPFCIWRKHLNYVFAIHELYHFGSRDHEDVARKAFVEILDYISVGYFEFLPKLCQLTLLLRVQRVTQDRTFFFFCL